MSKIMKLKIPNHLIHLSIKYNRDRGKITLLDRLTFQQNKEKNNDYAKSIPMTMHFSQQLIKAFMMHT